MSDYSTDAGITDTYRQPIVKEDSGELKAPTSIIKYPLAARAIFYKFRSDSFKRIQLVSEIEGIASGNPPYDPVKLEKDGLGHITNVNNSDFGAFCSKEDQAFWNLLNGTEYIAKFSVDDPDKFRIPEYEHILAKNFNYVVRNWDGFKTHMNTLSAQLTKTGLSPIFWDNEYDWRWKTVEYQRFFVADQASTDLSLLTCVCIVSDFTVQQLWQNYELTIKYPDESNWDKEELEYLLLQKANVFSKYMGIAGQMSFMDLQERFQNGDYNYAPLLTDTVQLVSMFYKEYDEKFTHYMFDPISDRNQQFLYRVEGQLDNINEALVIFTSSPGVFTLHANRGLGMKIYAPMQAIMRLDCTLFDMTTLSATPLIKTIPGGPSSFDTIRVYPGVPTNIGSAELQQNNLGANIPGVVQAAQYFQRKVQFNMANSGEDPSIPDTDTGSVSDTQARHKTMKETGFLKNIIAHFYSSVDRVYKNMFMRMLRCQKTNPGYEEARAFKDMCIADGLPERYFEAKTLSPWGLPKQFKSVTASRIAGDGSSAGLLMGLESLAQDVPAFTAKGQQAYKELKVMATLGQEYVEVFTATEDPDEMSGGASVAAQENNGFMQGLGAIFSPENNQRTHIGVHFSAGMDIMKRRTQQQMGAREADKIFAVLIPHLAEHIGYEAQVPWEQPYVDSIKKPWNQLQQYAQLNRKNAEAEVKAEIGKQQQLQDKQTEVMSDIQRKDTVAAADIRRSDIKVASQIERAKEASETRGEIQRGAAADSAQTDRLKVTMNAQTKGQESLSDLRQELDGMTGSTVSPTDIEGIQ